MDKLSGSVERITYYNPENGYTVLRLRPEVGIRSHTPGLGYDGLTTVVGSLPELSPGEHLRLQGQWETHPKHGKQFKVEFCEQSLPASLAGIESYLGSGLIKGIGPKLAERIVAVFQENTFEIIEKQPERLSEVPGIGLDRSERIKAAWREQLQVKEIMVFLHGHGISSNLAVKIYKTYGDKAIETIRDNPYQLERDIFGIGFKTADRIAQALGLAPEHPARIEAGLVFALNELINDGNVYAPLELLSQRALELLAVPPDLIPPALERLSAEKRIHNEIIPADGAAVKNGAARQISEQTATYESGAPVVYLTPLYFGEKGVAERLKGLCEATPLVPFKNTTAVMPEFNLSTEQQAGVEMAFRHPLSVLTGGPGTGKTTCLKALITLLEKAHWSYALASPTGRAAKRLSEASGRQAVTLHRLLEFSPSEGFKRNDEHPLDVDFLIVDETSMLDLLLANNLLKALHAGAHLLLVGDTDQLPSVGAGDVLHDIITSGIAPVTRLTNIFRQAAGSHIITNAHLINQGKPPVFAADSSDFFLFSAEDAEKAADWTVEVVAERIPRKFGLNPLLEIQVLSPLYRGAAGVNALNQRLQDKLNAASAGKNECRLFGELYRNGDKVMQTRNNYEKDVFNGDIGFITAIDAIEHTLTVNFDGRPVRYDWNEADELTLAYAISVHKAQGSEFPAVVLPVVTQHYLMLQRNLLYTAITRASRLCVLVGNQRAINMAVRNNKVSQRYSALQWRLGK